ncbi:phage portal protein [Nanchangia anserum]|uniref:phage portal protein n=1 Tax=Nanchangia anserum TaxID=2692125 RepID=UPI001884179B|nr:phage portal protein [Nanchangia anserum]QOX82033.1 phage portal protein [Nanchangia anserum]
MSNPIEILQACQRRIESHASYNVERAAWYDAKQRVKSLDISIPRDIDARVETALGWPALVVDALEERLNINGFATATANREVEATLGRVWRDNDLDIEYSQAHLEALIHGVAFLCAQPGGDGDPAPTITVESPATMTGIWDPVRRELSAAPRSSTTMRHGNMLPLPCGIAKPVGDSFTITAGMLRRPIGMG